jgi:hypothetical protein
MIYKGSQKQGKVYKGGIKIGEIYKGSQLVYQSGLKLYVANYSTSSYNGITYYIVNGLLDSWSTSGYVFECTYKQIQNNITTFLRDTITSITGTLGSSGSNITIANSSPLSYTKTLIMSGKRVYLYDRTYVLDGSIVGNYAMSNQAGIFSMNMPEHPTSVTSNQYTFNISDSYSTQTVTVTKTSSDVLIFTKENDFVYV